MGIGGIGGIGGVGGVGSVGRLEIDDDGDRCSGQGIVGEKGSLSSSMSSSGAIGGVGGLGVHRTGAGESHPNPNLHQLTSLHVSTIRSAPTVRTYSSSDTDFMPSSYAPLGERSPVRWRQDKEINAEAMYV